MDKRFLRKCEISCDKVGELYFYENKVFRKISEEYRERTLLFLKSNLFKEIISKNYLPATEILEERIFEDSLVLEHENITPFTMAYEWSPFKLKQATILILDLWRLCLKHGYTLIDPHIYNIVEGKHGLVYLDFGSFQEIKNKTELSKAYTIFERNFIIPMMLIKDTRFETARTLYLRRSEFPDREVYALLSGSKRWLSYQFCLKLHTTFKKMQKVESSKWIEKGVPSFLAKILESIFYKKIDEEYLANIKHQVEMMPYEQHSKWGKYQRVIHQDDKERLAETLKVVKGLGKFESIVDLACNEGLFSKRLIEKDLCEIVYALDNDADALNQLDSHNNARIKSIYADCIRPDGRSYDENLSERIKSECVVALALTHHLFITQAYPWETIIENIAKYTTKYLLIEFMPLGLYDGNEASGNELPKDYSEEAFTKALCQKFAVLQKIKTGKNRILFVGESNESK